MTTITSLYNVRQAIYCCRNGNCNQCNLKKSNDCMGDILKLLNNVEDGLNGNIQIRPKNKRKKETY